MTFIHYIPKFHPFNHAVSSASLPERFTFPFQYVPHPLCKEAAEELQAYLKEQKQWERELGEGKMFGVLVVQTANGEVGYLAAFSGMLAGSNLHDYFVPPVYDLQHPGGFFVAEECAISDINNRIKLMEQSPIYQQYRQHLENKTHKSELILDRAKETLKQAKEARALRRLQSPTEEELDEMVKESQFQKAEFKRLKQYWYEQLGRLRDGLRAYERGMEELKSERKERSAALQQRLFGEFRILNARGEEKNLCDIFEETAHKVPPAGAGECAAPRLLQYAYKNKLKPVAMAEFWWGASPATEIRRQGEFYPACKGKCEPILNFMLQGLKVEDNPLYANRYEDIDLEIVYEDKWLVVVNKPAGMLSVPGNTGQKSVYDWFRQHYPDASGPMMVHRLDMDTSGLLMIAKNKIVHQRLQAQFKNRQVKKRYVALLAGRVETDEGIIDLPLCPDPVNRPRQLVSAEFGKPAITRYRVLQRMGKRTLVAFYPLTGRTHQLRVHAAHPRGLNTPILGDSLYGNKASRLYLFAEYLELKHPISGKQLCLEKKSPFTL